MASLVPPFHGPEPEVETGWRYQTIIPSGHFAYDYAMPIGTPLYAVGNGKVLAAADGIHNNVPGERIYSGKPSNWILLGVHYDGNPASVYYQHLSPGHGKHAGMHVDKDELLCHSGLSGNTSGPHLHIATMHGWWDTATRYIYMQNDGDNPYVIFPPSLLWRDPEMPLSRKDKEDIADMTADKVVNRVFGERLFGKDASKDDQDVTFRTAQRDQYHHATK